PGADGEAWDAEIDAEDLLGSPQLLHPGKTAPRSLQSAWITIYDPYVGYALELQAEGSGKSALACAADQHVKHLGAATRARQGPFSRGIAHICQLAPHPIRELDDTHGPCPLTKPQTRRCRSPRSDKLHPVARGRNAIALAIAACDVSEHAAVCKSF